jgi:hypothetical protein
MQAAAGSAGASRRQLPLPAAISPIAAAEGDSDPFCAESAALQQYVTNSSGWKTSTMLQAIPCPHPNCNTHGFAASGAGKTLEFMIDTQNSISGAAFERRALVGIFLATKTSDWWRRMGVAQLTCVRGCSCSPAKMAIADIHQQGDNFWGSLATTRTEVRLQAGCTEQRCTRNTKRPSMAGYLSTTHSVSILSRM